MKVKFTIDLNTKKNFESELIKTAVGDKDSVTLELTFKRSEETIDLTNINLEARATTPSSTSTPGQPIQDKSGFNVVDAKSGRIDYTLPEYFTQTSGAIEDLRFILTNSETDAIESSGWFPVWIDPTPGIKEVLGNTLDTIKEIYTTMIALSASADDIVKRYSDTLSSTVTALTTQINTFVTNKTKEINDIFDPLKAKFDDLESGYNTAITEGTKNLADAVATGVDSFNATIDKIKADNDTDWEAYKAGKTADWDKLVVESTQKLNDALVQTQTLQTIIDGISAKVAEIQTAITNNDIVTKVALEQAVKEAVTALNYATEDYVNGKVKATDDKLGDTITADSTVKDQLATKANTTDLDTKVDTSVIGDLAGKTVADAIAGAGKVKGVSLNGADIALSDSGVADVKAVTGLQLNDGTAVEADNGIVTLPAFGGSTNIETGDVLWQGSSVTQNPYTTWQIKAPNVSSWDNLNNKFDLEFKLTSVLSNPIMPAGITSIFANENSAFFNPYSISYIIADASILTLKKADVKIGAKLTIKFPTGAVGYNTTGNLLNWSSASIKSSIIDGSITLTLDTDGTITCDVSSMMLTGNYAAVIPGIKSVSAV